MNNFIIKFCIICDKLKINFIQTKNRDKSSMKYIKW